ncbi:hypothetical protein, partial [Streptomyces atriruber]|uniref:hypothetical protein n=1 Tax=Streptomyces atriruber TaxID=545121 RepID=UPI001ABF66B7
MRAVGGRVREASGAQRSRAEAHRPQAPREFTAGVRRGDGAAAGHRAVHGAAEQSEFRGEGRGRG